MPKSRLDFWKPKLEANKKRDVRSRRQLTALGWQSLVIWECEAKDNDKLERRIKAFLDREE
jgi:DNA mismatch endonuclease (patch repair protein)